MRVHVCVHVWSQNAKPSEISSFFAAAAFQNIILFLSNNMYKSHYNHTYHTQIYNNQTDKNSVLSVTVIIMIR